MKITNATANVFYITEMQALDPITVVLQDISPGAGRIIIECFGSAWSTSWGGMGDRSVRDFILSCDASYLSARLWSQNQKLIKKHQDYLFRIATAVREALRLHS